MRVDELIWDDWNEQHIAEHNVTPDEVEEACQTKPIQARRTRDDKYAVFGTTDSGRYLTVILSSRGRNSYYVVTARDMDVRERATYRKAGK
ncbi:hypothetical protein OG802_24220 [Streptomyces sp. NBC_00704]|uniref:BrnT family toxin n=1 Tax=Streptomyces sp. NBC_00704 TaxID=2975809 RepID=UPI002E332B49|nr:BrnT family toxin [Streptomyces sp. NBC_00704]